MISRVPTPFALNRIKPRLGMGGKRIAARRIRAAPEAALSASVEECRAQKLQTHETHYRGICASRRWLPL
jgi:hypothetical protein